MGKKAIYCATPSRMKQRTRAIMDFVTAQGHGPIHPLHALEYERFEGGPVGREKTMELCCLLAGICDEFWLFGISEGTPKELTHMLSEHSTKPIRFLLHDWDRRWRECLDQWAEQFPEAATYVRRQLPAHA